MKTTVSFFFMETRRVLNIKTIGLLVLISALSLYFTQTGIKSYLEIMESKQAYWDFEQVKVSQYPGYGQYGTYGVQVLFVPSPLYIFFINSTTVSRLTANVDSGERLYIYNSFKGRELFAEKSGGYKDFSGVFLLLASLLMFYAGYDAFTHRDYLGFMNNFIRPRALFSSIIACRVVIFGLWIAATAALSLLLLKINGIEISGEDGRYFAIFLGVLGLVVFFFFILGTISGTFGSPFAGFAMIVTLWFVSVFMIPGLMRTLITQSAESITSISRMDLEKLRLLMKVEDMMQNSFGSARELRDQAELKRLVGEKMLEHWEKEYKEFYALEKRIENEVKDNIRFYAALSDWFPTTFYLSCGNEISGSGYENYLEFFSWLQELKKNFTLFYMKQRFLSPAPEGKGNIQCFFREGENFFQARTRLPWRFSRGILISLGYIAILLAVSYIRFKKSLLRA